MSKLTLAPVTFKIRRATSVPSSEVLRDIGYKSYAVTAEITAMKEFNSARNNFFKK